MQYLDGKRLKRAVNAGWLWLDQNRDRLNAINVFPVADGDTGTNMALTLKAAAAGANSAKSESLQDVADSIALHSLRGAQGNSGVILSQYFKGVAEYIRKRDRLSLDQVAEVFKAGSQSAYCALKEPKEGTILTVIREMAEHLEQTKGKFHNLMNLLQTAVDRGRTSLSETKAKLKVLADAGVVDAGGQGFVHFVEGIHHLIKTGELALKKDREISEETVPLVVQEHSAFRYCSEFLIHGRSFDTDNIKNRLDNLGDSLIVASTGSENDQYLRIHIHTDDPDSVYKVAVEVGELETKKIEDMKAQNTAMRRWRSKIVGKTKTVRIVTDSTCDLPRETAEFYDIEIVPLKVMFDDKVYRDNVDLGKDRFYEMLRQASQLPKTSQPAPADFSDLYQKVLDRGDCEEIISIHVSSKLSGTFNSSIVGSQSFDNKVINFDSRSVSLGLAMLAITAAEMARKGKSSKEIIKRLETLRANQKIYFTLGTIDYLIKGGRVSGARAILGKFLGLKPILSIEDGEVAPFDKARSEEKLLERIIAALADSDPSGLWAVGHASIPSKVDEVVSVLESKLGAEKILTGEIGPTVGTHAGPGTWGIFYTKG